MKITRNFKILRKKSGSDFWFYFIPLISATIFLAGTAAYFSVFGLSKVFAGAKTPAIIMASAIEFGKIIAVSFTNRYWNHIGKLKGYLLAAIVVAMVITSASIFGFLSDAYQKTADKLSVVEGKVKIEENRKEYLSKQIDSYNNQILLKKSRVEQLNNLRANQEIRVDSLYKKGWTSSAKRAETQITNSSNEIIELNNEISELSSFTFSITDSINAIEERILTYKSTDVSAELGPIIFVRDLFGLQMNTVVVIFIFLIIFVFDPMAMALVISINKLFVIRDEQNKDKPEIDATVDTGDMSIDKRFEEINNEITSKSSGLIVKPQIEDINANNRK